MRGRKLLEKALRNPQGLRFEEVKRLAIAFGFRLDRVSGSHHVFVRAGIPQFGKLAGLRWESEGLSGETIAEVGRNA